MIERLAGLAIVAFARAVTGVRANWTAAPPEPGPRVYFANHNSHGDFVLIWTVLPRPLRRATRPVAGADYWDRGTLRRFIGRRVFRSVLVERGGSTRTHDPIADMAEALAGGDSLILFPEGTRNTSAERLLAFKSGLYHLARARPETELVPVWIDNLNRVMPKGEILPVPLLCSVSFGAALRLEEGEDKAAFLERMRAAMLALAPAREPS